MMELEEDYERASDVFDLPLGTLIEDSDTQIWVFIGVSENVVGGVLNFARVKPEKQWRGEDPVSVYRVAMAGTALKKFPALEQHRRQHDGQVHSERLSSG